MKESQWSDPSLRARLRHVIDPTQPKPPSPLVTAVREVVVFVICVAGAVVVLTALSGGFR
jgi:hypothetical protein